MAIGLLGTLGEYTPSSGNSLGGEAPAKATPWARESLLITASRRAVSSSYAAAKAEQAPAGASSAYGGCGPEPERKQVGPGFVAVDPAYSKKWHECLAAASVRELAAAKAAIDAAKDCGVEPPLSLSEKLDIQDLRKYWALCRAKKPAAPTAQTTSPAIVPGQTTAVPSSLTSSSSSSSSSTPQQVAPDIARSTATVGPGLALALGPTPSSNAIVASTGPAHPSALPSLSSTETAALVVGGGVVLAGLAWLLLRKKR